jgi:hypothetical protein
MVKNAMICALQTYEKSLRGIAVFYSEYSFVYSFALTEFWYSGSILEISVTYTIGLNCCILLYKNSISDMENMEMCR